MSDAAQIDDRTNLLERIDQDRDKLIEFLSRFIQAKSPNPPGDTREAAAHVTAFLDARGLPYEIIEAHPEMPRGGGCNYTAMGGHD